MVSLSLIWFRINRNPLKDNRILDKLVIRALSSNEGKALRPEDEVGFW